MALQQEIIQALGVKPQIDASEEIRVSVDFLKSYLKTYPFIKSLVLGISGGQDSTLTGKLCQLAITELREESGDDSYQFIAVQPAFWRARPTSRTARMPLPSSSPIAC